MAKEIWKDIQGYEGLYKISNLGKVFSYNKEKKFKNGIMKLNNDGHGYLEISLKKEGKRKHFKIHRLVAFHFLKNEDNKKQINHKDFNTLNNVVDNLEWVTPSENIQHLKKNKGISNQFSDFDKVAQYDFDGVLLKTFKNPLEAAKFLGVKNSANKYDARGINDCCRNKQKSYKNYIWKYYKNEPLQRIEKYNKSVSSLARKITAIDKNGNETIFNTITEASKKLNIKRPYISAVLTKKQKTTKGYSFKYFE